VFYVVIGIQRRLDIGNEVKTDDKDHDFNSDLIFTNQESLHLPSQNQPNNHHNKDENSCFDHISQSSSSHPLLPHHENEEEEYDNKTVFKRHDDPLFVSIQLSNDQKSKIEKHSPKIQFYDQDDDYDQNEMVKNNNDMVDDDHNPSSYLSSNFSSSNHELLIWSVSR